jgi:hypothetical protein
MQPCRVISVLAISVGLSSCMPEIYVPMVHSAPQLAKQGDVAISGNLALATMMNGSLAYAFFDNWSIMMEGAYDPANNRQSHEWLAANIGFGFSAQVTDSVRVELYSGAGRGAGRGRKEVRPEFCVFCPRETWAEDRQTELSTSNLFVTGSIGYRMNILSLIISGRASRVRIDKFSSRWTRTEDSLLVGSSSQSGHGSFTSLEGTLMLRLNGIFGLNLFGYLTVARPIPRTIMDEDHYLGGNIGLGLQYRFNILD